MSKKRDPDFWKPIGEKLRQVRAGQPTGQFLSEHGLDPRLPWNSIEVGSRGFDVETFKTICEALDLSPTWVLLDIGQPHLSHITKMRLVREKYEELKAFSKTLPNIKYAKMVEVFGEELGYDEFSGGVAEAAARGGSRDSKKPQSAHEGATKRR
jgi:hypothetical protein